MSFTKSVGWADLSINPIKGLCQGGCWYCYYSGKRGIAHRFKQDPELRLDLSVFDRLPKAPRKIFLCSTNDYWGGWIPAEWREAIRQKTQEYPQHTFQVLTKQYQNLVKDSPYPSNWWVGITATNTKMFHNACYYLASIEASIKYLSLEPFLEWEDDGYQGGRMVAAGIKLVIIGRLTGYGHKYDPKLEWVEEIVRAADRAGVKVFLKDNLKPLLRNSEGWTPAWAVSAREPDGSKEYLRQEMPV